MKKIIYATVTGMLLALMVNAQDNKEVVKAKLDNERREEEAIRKDRKMEHKSLNKLEGKDVSSLARTAFYSDFGNIAVKKWERSANFDEATFTRNGQVMKAYYDAEAKLVGTTRRKSFSDIPIAAQNEINMKYPGYAKTDVVFFDDNEVNESDMILFGSQFDDADNYFVNITNGHKEILLKVDMRGRVSFFKELK